MSLSPTGRTWDDASSPTAVGLARRYEAAWRQAPTPSRRPDPAEYLDAAGDGPGARLALLRADMVLRWEAGERAGVDGYRARFPGLEGEALVALIYEEFCLREEAEEGPTPEEYLTRYPEVAPALRRVLDIHGLVGSGQTTGSHGGGASAPGVVFPQAGETIAGFRLTEELGRGAFARVFLAQERQLADRPVALKVSRTGSREPQTLARLQHTHIVPVYSYRTDAATGLHLLCMPYFGRVTLARVLADPKARVARNGSELVAAVDRLGATEPPPPGRSAGRAALARRTYAQAVAWWGARLAEGLEHAHDRGVLHRDVKPSNVLVTADGMPMLLDFNLAREARPGDDEADRAAPGGTLDYMAPEHLEELADGVPGRVGARSDVYGLGVLLYEAMAGAKPFAPPRGSESAGEMLLRAAEDRRRGAPRLRAARPEVPAAVEAVVRRCLEPDPNHRYPTAAALAADLQAVADDRPLRYAAEPWPHRARRWARRHRRALATAVPVALALSGVGALMAQEQLDRGRLWSKVKRLYDEGLASEARGDLDRARVQFESAVRLVDRPDGGAAGGPAPEAPSSLWPSLDALRQQARDRYRMAVRAGDYRDAADELSRAADPLRFRLSGFGRDLATASRGLDAVLRPFHVFEPDDWLDRPDLRQLDSRRRQRLAREVNELLFLWALALGREDDPVSLGRASQACDLALRFAEPSAPWRALKARVDHRLGGGDGSASAAVLPGEGDRASALACFQWGALRLLEGRRDDALPWLKKAVRLEEDNYWFHYDLAFAHDEPAGNPAEALRHYDAAVALKPKSPWVRYCRARLYRERREWGLAAEDFARALSDFRALPASDRDPEFESQARLELGLVRQSLGDLAGARSEYAAAAASDPSGDYARAARLNLAKVDADAGALARAREGYDALLEQTPGDPEALRGRALLALRGGAPARAEADLSALIASGPESEDRAEALAARALARLSLGRAAEAAADAEEAMRVAPRPRMERLRTRARVALARPGDAPLSRPGEVAALPAGGAALRADLLRLAAGLRRTADTASGAESLRARLSLAVTLAALGDPSAEAEAGRAVALAPLSARPYQTRARVRLHAGRVGPARADADRAVELEPDDPRAWSLRGEVRVRAGDPTGGLADLDRAVAMGEAGAVRALRAAALAALGDPHGAVRDWSGALEHDPDDPLAYLGRAEAYLSVGHWDQALADLEHAAGWVEGRPELVSRVALGYARCLPHRPGHLARLLTLARRVWAAPSGAVPAGGLSGVAADARPRR